MGAGLKADAAVVDLMKLTPITIESTVIKIDDFILSWLSKAIETK